jgi:hypothetical protein
MSTCPSCDASNVEDHPAGILGGWSHSPTCAIGNAEDATRAADYSRLFDVDCGLPLDSLTRVTTTAEAQLLTALGYVPTLMTVVTRVTDGGAVIRRDFGQLVALPP